MKESCGYIYIILAIILDKLFDIQVVGFVLNEKSKMNLLEEEATTKPSFSASEFLFVPIVLILINMIAIRFVFLDAQVSIVVMSVGPLFMGYMIKRVKKLAKKRRPPFSVNPFLHVFHLSMIGTVALFMFMYSVPSSFERYLTFEIFLVVLFIEMVLFYYYDIVITNETKVD